MAQPLLKRRTVRAAVGWTLLGLAMLTGSFFAGWGSGAGWAADWLSGVLVEVGAAVAVLVPLYWITRNLDRHIDKVREETVASVEQVRADTASSVEALTERVTSFQDDVERLEDIVSSVSRRLSQERFREAVVRDAVRKAPTREGVLGGR